MFVQLVSLRCSDAASVCDVLVANFMSVFGDRQWYGQRTKRVINDVLAMLSVARPSQWPVFLPLVQL